MSRPIPQEQLLPGLAGGGGNAGKPVAGGRQPGEAVGPEALAGAPSVYRRRYLVGSWLGPIKTVCGSYP